MLDEPSFLVQLWRNWPALSPWQLQPLHRHARNVMSLVHTANGTRYILRVTAHSRRRLAYELDLVTRLQYVSLPFAIPAPLPTRTGELFVPLPAADGQVALLYPFLSGSHSSGGNQRHAFAAGRALATLQAALATLDDLPTGSTAPFPTAEHLAVSHAAVVGSLAWLSDLPIASEQQTQLQALIDAVRATTPALYASLPRQRIHNDYDGSNVLLAGQRITAILDFELSTTDLRALDLAVALCWWPRAAFADRRRWEVMDAFGRGYAQAATLTADEVMALPTLLRLRTIATLIQRVERYLVGHDPEEIVVRRIGWTLEANAWITAIEDELRRRAAAWRGRAPGSETGGL